jgi:hypothetical protein
MSKFYKFSSTYLSILLLLGCFSILPATEIVPGDILEVGGTASPSDDFLLVPYLAFPDVD